MRPAAGRVNHQFFQVRQLHALKKALEMPFFAPVGIPLVHHVPFAQSFRKISPGRARAGNPEQGIEELPLRPSRATFARR